MPTPPVLDAQGRVARGGDPDRPLLSGTFGSFADAPDGFSEELKEIALSVGAEYWYRDVFSGRVGYFYENPEKGDRNYLTLGVGFRYQVLGIDFSYLVATRTNDPLAETLRVTLLFNFNKEEEDASSSN